MPTFAALGGGKVPAGTQGINLEWTLLGRRGQFQHSYFYWEFHEEGGKRALRMGKWKAIQLNVNKDPNGPVQIYDLDHDIGETTNVAAQHPDLVAKARRLFITARTSNPNFDFPEPAQ
jgi:arylsulfatase A-like enzyme